jgi:hypothetical protein
MQRATAATTVSGFLSSAPHPNEELVNWINYIFAENCAVNTYRWVLDWMTEFIITLYTQFGTTGNYTVTAICTLYSSPLHTH